MKRIILGLLSVLLLALIVYYFYPEAKIPVQVAIDRIIVFKSKRQLLVFSQGRLIKTYTISLGREPIGQKNGCGRSTYTGGHL